MNHIEKGKEFEKKSKDFLQTIFDKVEWLSEKNKTALDFRCYKGEVELYGDAKFVTYGSPTLNFRQRDADFIVTNKGDKIIIIFKEDFAKKVCIEKKEMKHLTLEEDTWKKLMKIKLKEKFKSMDSLIIKLLEKYE